MIKDMPPSQEMEEIVSELSYRPYRKSKAKL